MHGGRLRESRHKRHSSAPSAPLIVVADNPLRETVTADGPSDLGRMFEAGNHIIESMASAAEAVFTFEPIRVRLLEAAANGTKYKESAMQAKRTSRGSTNRAAVRSIRRARAGARRIPIAVEAASANSRGRRLRCCRCLRALEQRRDGFGLIARVDRQSSADRVAAVERTLAGQHLRGN